MPQIVSIILALGLVFVISSAHYMVTQLWKAGDVKSVLSVASDNLLSPPENPDSKITQWIEPVAENDNSSIDTFIIDGPKEDEVITNTKQVTFKFRVAIYSKNLTSPIVFQTKVSGIDSSWQESSYNSRTIQLKPGTNEYTFSVRAKSGNLIDNTPAKRTFTAEVSY